MPPLDYGDRINAASLAGTWFGSLLTGIGLLAVVTQLQSALRSLNFRQERMKTRSAGAWALCFGDQPLPERGVLESAVPAFSGWIQKFYMDDRSIRLTQCDRGTSGTGSWSKMLAQLDILPKDLIAYGGPKASVWTCGADKPRRPIQSDIDIKDSNIAYGFSPYEFAALLIIGGFEPEQFTNVGICHDVSHMGIMHVAEHGPFTQVAHYDPHMGVQEMHREVERFVNYIPVRRALNFGLGIISTVKRGTKEWIVIPEISNPDEPYSAWRENPSGEQLYELSYSMEQMTQISAADMWNYSEMTPEDLDFESSTMKKVWEEGVGNPRWREALKIAHAIHALQPWALPPVTPGYVVRAFHEAIEPFVGTREETVGFLCGYLMTATTPSPFGWHDLKHLQSQLKTLGDVKSMYFNQSPSACSWYFRAMNIMFRDHGIAIEAVGTALAAQAAYRVIHSSTTTNTSRTSSTNSVTKEPEIEAQPQPEPTSPPVSLPDRDEFVRRLSDHLGIARFLKHDSEDKSQGEAVVQWAVTLYATFIWGWLGDHRKGCHNLKGRFRRRIFLGHG